MANRWVAGIFAKFHSRYGNKWTSAYPPGRVLQNALHEWAEGLAGLNGAEIKRGLDTWDEDWPPSMHEFKRACRPPLPAPCYRDAQALPAPDADPEIARSALAALKDRLHGRVREEGSHQT